MCTTRATVIRCYLFAHKRIITCSTDRRTPVWYYAGSGTACLVTGGDDQAVHVGLFHISRQQRDKSLNSNSAMPSMGNNTNWSMRLVSSCHVESGHTSAVRVSIHTCIHLCRSGGLLYAHSMICVKHHVHTLNL